MVIYAFALAYPQATKHFLNVSQQSQHTKTACSNFGCCCFFSEKTRICKSEYVRAVQMYSAYIQPTVYSGVSNLKLSTWLRPWQWALCRRPCWFWGLQYYVHRLTPHWATSNLVFCAQSTSTVISGRGAWRTHSLSSHFKCRLHLSLIILQITIPLLYRHFILFSKRFYRPVTFYIMAWSAVSKAADKTSSVRQNIWLEKVRAVWELRAAR